MAVAKSQLTGDGSSVVAPAAATSPLRVGLYVDGFNLYHALEALGEKHLRWLDLMALAQLISPSLSSVVTRVVYCSAFYPGDSNRKWRHQMYLNALRARGVACELGHFVTEPIDCGNCGVSDAKFTEKEGDLNVALHLLNDAHNDLIDHAYLLTADSDQAATARLFRAQFPNKKLITVSPPGRNFSNEIAKHAHGRVALNRAHIEGCLLPAVVMSADGKHGRRPKEWAPPGEL